MKQESLERANAKLDRVTIIKRGKKLSLRATLPPKHGDGTKPKRYTLSTGLPLTSEGLKLALAKAQQLEADLIYERFSWNTTTQSQITVDNAITEFEKDYWNTREKTLNRTSNYKKDY